jgi:diguanylate cyclase (GGDEF)-like protein
LFILGKPNTKDLLFLELSMRSLQKYFSIRVLLIVICAILAVIAPDVFSLENRYLLKICYSAFFLLTILGAIFYKAPVLSNQLKRRKIRTDIEIPLPDDVATVSRDFQKDLMEKERLFQFMFNSSIDGFWTYDIPTGKVSWSDRAAFILGASQQELGDNFDILKTKVFEKDWSDFRNKFAEALNQSESFSTPLRLLIGKKEITISGRAQCNDEGRPICVFGSLSQPTERTAQFEKQNALSIYVDTLTGVRNRRCFLEKLEKEIQKAKERPDYLFALVLLDIDHFSAINDNYSLDMGDVLLQLVSERISLSCRQNDCVARIGPDVFGIILRNVQNNRTDDELHTIVRRLHSKVKTPLQIGSNEVYVSASMAVVVNREFDNVDDLLANANAMLREIKRSDDRGGIQFFTSGIREKAMKLYRLEFEIRKAIQCREFLLYYQPVIDIGDQNKIVAFEALVRWNNSERGIISPAEFIPMAEETGLIIPLGEMILQMACTQAKKWVDLGYHDIMVAVNFSAKQFAVDDMVEKVKRVLVETKLNPRNLKIEITEYSAMCEVEKTIDIMKALSGMGLQISIDDFGTGYSSLIYLKRYPIHTLKMDKSFVNHVAEDEEDGTFARMVIGIAQSLNLELIAEGVETKAQLEFLRNEGCRLIQGFYFSRPLSEVDALSYLEAHYLKNKTTPVLN